MVRFLSSHVPSPAFAHLKRVHAGASIKKKTTIDGGAKDIANTPSMNDESVESSTTSGASSTKRQKKRKAAEIEKVGQPGDDNNKSNTNKADQTSATISSNAGSTTTAAEVIPSSVSTSASSSSSSTSAPMDTSTGTASIPAPSHTLSSASLTPRILVLLCTPTEYASLPSDVTSRLTTLGVSSIHERLVPSQIPRTPGEAAMARAHWPVSLHTHASQIVGTASLQLEFTRAETEGFKQVWKELIHQMKQAKEHKQLCRGAVVVSEGEEQSNNNEQIEQGRREANSCMRRYSHAT